MKKLWIFALLSALLAVSSLGLVLACGGGGDDDDDDEEPEPEPGTCFWDCTIETSTTETVYSCSQPFETQDDCSDFAIEQCEELQGGKVFHLFADLGCEKCDDEDCWPDWYEGDDAVIVSQ
ncbi:MAG: hypothetical protein M5R36_05610 [Deltaproteobacteria bacterium]|nr:hypothetical protein [Deltaproteobacteria bacterium]